MTLQERQKREIERLTFEIKSIDFVLEIMTSSKGIKELRHIRYDKEVSLELTKNYPENYFKILDEEE